MAIRQVGLLSRRSKVGPIDRGRPAPGRSLPVSAVATGCIRPAWLSILEIGDLESINLYVVDLDHARSSPPMIALFKPDRRIQ